ncbi:MAG TPA: hypothetical protein VLG27_03840 [Candidatus Saccharimonadia bacterium]|nr:hypothetical protein [Candidatus Saccharimonadia bacterium]
MAEKVYDPSVKVPEFLKISKVIAWLMYAWVIFGIIMLTLRVFLLAFSANTAFGFAHFVMNTSSQYLNPFRGIFPGKQLGTTGYLDVSALFAIIVYLFVAWGFSALLNYIQSKIALSQEPQQKAINDAKRASAQRAQRPASTRPRA